jgi:hypothetical protein
MSGSSSGSSSTGTGTGSTNATTRGRIVINREFLRAIRRPLILGLLCAIFLLAHHILLRAMVHGHIAHVLLGAGNAPPDTGAATLAIALVIVRFISVIIVPGLGLAAAAEIVAYFLVGPKRTEEDEEEDDEDEEDPSTKEEAPRSRSH